MPAASPAIGKNLHDKLRAFGARLKAERKALKVSSKTTAEAAGLSRMTLNRIERGEPSVTIGAYLSAAAAVGLAFELIAPNKVRAVIAPSHIRIADFTQLQRIAWQLDEKTTLSPKDALSLYERNWRHVDKNAMSEEERQLLRAIGGERLLV